MMEYDTQRAADSLTRTRNAAVSNGRSTLVFEPLWHPRSVTGAIL